MIEIILHNRFWSGSKPDERHFHFIGYIYFRNDLFLSAESVANFFSEMDLSGNELQDFISKVFLPESNGNFALVIQDGQQTIAICDYTRNFPLYIINDSLRDIITDHPGKIEFNPVYDLSAQEEFLLSGLVSGRRTVYSNVTGIQAGEMVVIGKTGTLFNKYFIYRIDPFKSMDPVLSQNLYDRMNNLFLSTIEKMIKSCPGVNNWIVPLSGGHDSRLILNYLYKLGCKNVICFSYGIPYSKEAEISKMVADRLGYEWHFVEYTSEEWGNLWKNNLLDDYINYSFNGSCLPHIQDFLAIFKLKEESIISDNDVIVPGHTAFTETANPCIKEFLTVDQSIEYVYNKYFCLFDNRSAFNKIKPALKYLFDNYGQDKYSYPAFFNIQERQSKFICNSVRVYDYFGLKWRLPLWEKSLIDFWRQIDFDDRIERKVFFSASNDLLFDKILLEIPFINKFEQHNESVNILKKILPDILISIVVFLLNRNVSINEGTNLIFNKRSATAYRLAGPGSLYPKCIRRYIRSVLFRRPHQVNVNSLCAIYTLRKEIYLRQCANE